MAKDNGGCLCRKNLCTVIAAGLNYIDEHTCKAHEECCSISY